ncbi:MAG: M48 family metallopeptidase [Lachnospiraceae bacterium]|nr:M48 family metallopeptidase [Lachnospiraceae bacterium]
MSETKVLRTVTGAQGDNIVYELTRKSVKNVNLRIRPDGSVAVSANRRVTLAFLDDFVRSKAEFIRAAQERCKKRAAQTNERQYISGDEISFCGRMLTLTVFFRQSRQCIVRRVGESLELYAPVDSSKDQRAAAIENWYCREAAAYLPALCRRWYPVFEARGIAYPDLRIRKMTSRWGVCQPRKGVVTLSTMLMQVPEEAAEYVVVHEFSHFLVPDHSGRFYAVVESVLPDWKTRKAMLGG